MTPEQIRSFDITEFLDSKTTHVDGIQLLLASVLKFQQETAAQLAEIKELSKKSLDISERGIAISEKLMAERESA